MAAGAPPRIRIARAALIITAVSMLSRVGGLVRQVVLARVAGLGVAVDSYAAAYRIISLPGMILQRTIPVVLLPRFAGLAAGTDDASPDAPRGGAVDPTREAWRLASAFLFLLAGVLGVAAVGLIVAAGPIARLSVSGGDGSGAATTASCIRIMAFAAAAQAASWAVGALLQAHDRFTATAATGLAVNLGTVAGTLALYDQIGIRGAAVGTMIGAVGGLVIQAPGLWAIRPRGTFAFRHAALGATLVAAGPVLLTSVIHQLNSVTDVYFTSVQEGGLAALSSAGLLVGVPQTLFVISLATPLFPALVGAVARGPAGRAEFGRLHRRAANLTAISSIPITVLTLVYAEPVARLFFGGGETTDAQVDRTALALQASVVSLWAVGLLTLDNRCLLALGRVRAPLVVGIVAIATNLVLDVLLYRPYGVAGVAAATSIAQTVNMVGQLWWLERVEPGLDLRGLARDQGRILLGCLAVPAVAIPLRLLWPVPDAKLAAIGVLAAQSALALAAAYVALRALGVPEAREVVRRLTARRGSRRAGR